MSKFIVLLLGLLTLSACTQSAPMSDESETGSSASLYETYADAFLSPSDGDGEVSFGAVTASYGDEGSLIAAFATLDELEEGYFYEGWVVRSEPQSVISTGAMYEAQPGEGDGLFYNLFSHEANLSDHVKYIITLEPDDGDPAPAGHVVEGVLQSLE